MTRGVSQHTYEHYTHSYIYIWNFSTWNFVSSIRTRKTKNFDKKDS
jgi:hypothetical protein